MIEERKVAEMDPGYLFWCLKIVKRLQFLLDCLLGLLIGYTTSGGWKNDPGRQRSDRKVQVVKILWRSAYLDSDYHDLNNYVYVHHAWLEPGQIFETFPRLTLHGLSRDLVWFCDPGGGRDLDVYDCRKFPFAWHAQNNNAKKFVLMSHQQFFDVRRDDKFDAECIRKKTCL